MAHLRSKMDLMHVPTPDEVIDRLRAILHVPQGCVALDPCCGTGAALKRLVPNGKTYGIELELERGRKARRNLDHVIVGAMQDARVSHDRAGLLFLNPPYDDSTEGRLEDVFLERCSKYLKPDGILVLIVKEGLYKNLAGHIMRHFEVLGHWRFPEPYFDGPELAFGQTVLVARRRGVVKWGQSSKDFWTDALRLGDEEKEATIEALPEEWPEDDRIRVPAGNPISLFISGEMNPDDVAMLLAESDVPRDMKIPDPLGCGAPPLPLKQGHIALTLASGVINGPYGHGELHHMAKGSVVRVQTRSEITDVTAAGDPCLLVQDTDSFAIKVRVLLASGEIKDLTGSAAELAGDEEVAA